MNKSSVSLQDKTTSFLQPAQGMLQRKCACGNKTVASGECTECSKNKSGLQRKLAIGVSNDPLEREADRVADQVLAMPTNSSIGKTPPRIQRFTGQSTGQSDTAPASVDRVLASSGRPMEPVLRQDMEQRFGQDFSQVRVHSGSAAEQSTRDVSAHAYTAGHSIVFGAGQFAPRTLEGRKLLAHELTHVVQQSGAEGIRVGVNAISSTNGVIQSKQQIADKNSEIRHNISSAQTKIQRKCGSEAINEPSGCTFTADGVNGLRYLFVVNCDEFALGNEEDLRIDSSQIQTGDVVQVHGIASIEGDPTFNLNLSCARALRAKAVIEDVLAKRGVSATILVFNHGASEGNATQQRSVVVTRMTPEPVQPSTICGPDATDWFIRQVNAAKVDPTILALKARLAGAERLARRFGFSAEAIAEGAVARKVLAEETRVGSPARTREASTQLAASVPGQRALVRALIAAPIPLVGAPEAFVLAAIRGSALTWKRLVETGAKYDFKNDSRTMMSPTSDHCPVDCANTITLCSSSASDCFVVDVPGNLFYAHVGRFVGWTELTLQLGSQFAQLDASATWDPPEDTRMIRLGFVLPDPLSRNDLCSAINANRSIFTLRDCANCDEETAAEVI